MHKIQHFRRTQAACENRKRNEIVYIRCSFDGYRPLATIIKESKCVTVGRSSGGYRVSSYLYEMRIRRNLETNDFPTTVTTYFNHKWNIHLQNPTKTQPIPIRVLHFPIEMDRKERRRRARFDVYRIWEDFQRSPLKVPLRWGGWGSRFFWNKRVLATILPE